MIMMKTTFFAAALSTVSLFTFGDEIFFNNQFEKDKAGKIAQWKFNEIDEYKPLGNVSAEGNVLKLSSTGKAIHYYSDTNFDVKKGDTLRISLRAEGKGKVGFGAYFYGSRKGKNEKGVFSYGIYPHFEVSAEPKVFTQDFIVGGAGANPGVEIQNGRIVLCADKGSEVKISDLKAEIINKEAPGTGK